MAAGARERPDWLQALRRYLTVTALANLVWETAHLPLYTLWNEGTTRDKVFAVLHCTAGDVVVAVGVWALAMVLAGRPGWPVEAFPRVAGLVLVSGLVYTGFSEWLNTAVRHSWAYGEWMPVIPGLELGLSPMLQWVAVPAVALAAARGGFAKARILPA